MAVTGYIIGIDIGTTHVKSVLAGSEGKVLFEAKEHYPTFSPLPGRQEQDPEVIFQAVLQVLRLAIQEVDSSAQIGCVSFSAAMHSVLAVDEDGKPLTAAMTWADTRSRVLAAALKESPAGEAIYRRTGTPVHPMSPLCKIAWIKQHAPDVFAKSNKFISIKEYVFFRLFGVYVVDVSIASATGLFDVYRGQWDAEALAFAGIGEQRLSAVVPPRYAITSLSEAWLRQLGLQHAVPFLVGAGDGCLANIGAGAVLPGELALTIGTSGAVRKLSVAPVPDPQQRLFNYRVDDRSFLCGGAINNGGIVLSWLAELFLPNEEAGPSALEELMTLAGEAPPGARGLLFLPYLYGERAPVWDASARGVYLGVGAQHGRAEFTRAVIEGICFSLRQIVEALEETGEPVEKVFANGGFIQSSLWLQTLADVLQKKISVSRAADASAMGAIFWAMWCMGQIERWEDVKPMITVDEVYLPDPANGPVYEKLFSIFKGLYPKLSDDFHALDA